MIPLGGRNLASVDGQVLDYAFGRSDISCDIR
jgi:hypothetical protein